MAVTYEIIQSTTIGTNSPTSYTFSSIPSTYTDLKLIISDWGGDQNHPLYMRFNSDSGANYSWIELRGSGSAVTSNRTNSTNQIYITKNIIPGSSSITHICITDIFNYSNTTTFKSSLTRANSTGGLSVGAGVGAGLWRSTSAINSIYISADFGGFNIGSTFSLYGIKEA